MSAVSLANATLELWSKFLKGPSLQPQPLEQHCSLFKAAPTWLMRVFAVEKLDMHLPNSRVYYRVSFVDLLTDLLNRESGLGAPTGATTLVACKRKSTQEPFQAAKLEYLRIFQSLNLSNDPQQSKKKALGTTFGIPAPLQLKDP